LAYISHSGILTNGHVSYVPPSTSVELGSEKNTKRGHCLKCILYSLEINNAK